MRSIPAAAVCAAIAFLPHAAQGESVDDLAGQSLTALKAGDAKNPNQNDCEIIKVCTEADYTMANMEQAFPPLPAWIAQSPMQILCSQQFTRSANLQVPEREGVAGAEGRELLQGLQPGHRGLVQLLSALIKEIGISLAVGPSDSAAQLVQLGEPKAVGVFDD